MTDRLPPHSIEAEQGALSCCLTNPQFAIPEATASLKVESFYDLRHQTIYALIVEMWDERQPVDLLTVRQKLKDRNQLEQIGSVAYLAEVEGASPSAANIGYFVGILKEKSILRQLLRVSAEIDIAARDTVDDVAATLDRAQASILAISAKNDTTERPIKDLVRVAIGNIEAMHANQGAMTGIATGLSDLDRLTNGLQNGDMIVIAGRPSTGKTSLAMCIAEHVAIDLAIPVGVFSLEMTAEQLTTRMILSRSRMAMQRIRDGEINEGEFSKLTLTAGRIAKSNLHIDDASGLSILQLRSRARRMVQRHGIKLFIIDYLQLLHSTSRKADNRQQEISDISSGTKHLAKELGVPVVVLSQLNREMEKDKNRKPRLSDLRESGSIEQDADLVGLLYKPQLSGDEEPDPNAEAIPVNLLIAKQRNGQSGVDVNLTFLKPYTRFESRAFEPVEYEQTNYSHAND